jgi:uncharacterized protein YndB with AHSA1/START domain
VKIWAVLPATMFAAAPAGALVSSSSDTGFALTSSATIARPPPAVWAVLITPARWWSPDHSYSGDAANLTLDARADGCFCERLPGRPAGSVRHMTVLFARPYETLRLSGALGPLQAEGLSASLTVELKPAPAGATTVTFTYVVGGYSQAPLRQLALAVDRVLADQLSRLAKAATAAR